MAARRIASLRHRGSIYLGLAGALFAASGALVGGYVVSSGSATPAPAQAAEAPSADETAITTSVEAALANTVTIKVGEQSRTMRWNELGVVIDPTEVPHAARKASGGDVVASLTGTGAMPVHVERAAALDAIAHL